MTDMIAHYMRLPLTSDDNYLFLKTLVAKLAHLDETGATDGSNKVLKQIAAIGDAGSHPNSNSAMSPSDEQ